MPFYAPPSGREGDREERWKEPAAEKRAKMQGACSRIVGDKR